MPHLIIFLELMFGFFVIVRISDELLTKNLINESALTKIVAGYLIWILVWAPWPDISLIIFSIFVWIPVLFFGILPKILIRVRRERFRREMPVMLSSLVLKIRAGHSFRPALQSASQNLSEFSKIKVVKMLDALSFAEKSANFDEQTRQMMTFFRKMDQDSHQNLSRLIQLREKLKVEDEFYQKSARILHQLHAQAVIMTILYIALMVFVILRFGWSENAKVITISTFSFSLGLYFVFRQGRRFKWKV